MSDLPRSTIRIKDLLLELVAGIAQRPGRATLTALGTVIGVGVLVAVLGLSASASAQIGRQFDLTESTTVGVTQRRDPVRIRSLAFPLDAEDRARRVDGVEAAGLSWRLNGSPVVRSRPFDSLESSPEVYAMGAGAGVVATPVFDEGRWFDAGHVGRQDRVAVLGSGAAKNLAIGALSARPAITIDGLSFTVIGVVSDVGRMPEMLNAVVIPTSVAQALWGDPAPESPARLVVSVRVGAAEVVAPQLGIALNPLRPDDFTTTLPPDPRSLRETVANDLQTLFLLLGLVCLAVGGIGIANTTFVAVMERTHEIGLRRALGATPTHVGVQIVGEAALLGFLGGLVGTSLGTVGVVMATAILRWTAVVPVGLSVLGPVLGLAAGLVAGLPPARRAMRIEPVEAFRG